MGVLTHLDHFKTMAGLKQTKRRLKHRFWTEIYQGAKLFYLNGLINGKYRKQEIANLARFISTTKYRPLVWRQTHAYVVVDRIVDVTPTETLQIDPDQDRDIVAYGYLRGTLLRDSARVHIPGAGDYTVHSISSIADPCPLENKTGTTKRRTLNDKQRTLHAPFSDVGGVTYDEDAVYINVPGLYTDGAEEDRGEGPQMVRALQKVSSGLGDTIKDSMLKVFESSNPLPNRVTERRKVSFDSPEGEVDEDEEMEEEEEEEKRECNTRNQSDMSRSETICYADSDSEFEMSDTEREVLRKKLIEDGMTDDEEEYESKHTEQLIQESNDEAEAHEQANMLEDGSFMKENRPSELAGDHTGSIAGWKDAILEKASQRYHKSQKISLKNRIYGELPVVKKNAIIDETGLYKVDATHQRSADTNIESDEEQLDTKVSICLQPYSPCSTCSRLLCDLKVDSSRLTMLMEMRTRKKMKISKISKPNPRKASYLLPRKT